MGVGLLGGSRFSDEAGHAVAAWQGAFLSRGYSMDRVMIRIGAHASKHSVSREDG